MADPRGDRWDAPRSSAAIRTAAAPPRSGRPCRSRRRPRRSRRHARPVAPARRTYAEGRSPAISPWWPMILRCNWSPPRRPGTSRACCRAPRTRICRFCPLLHRSRQADAADRNTTPTCPQASIALRNIADLYIYPNTIRAVRVSGSGLKDWLERSAGVFNRIRPDVADQLLLNPDAPTSQLRRDPGVTYRIDLTQPSRFDLARRACGPCRKSHRRPVPRGSSRHSRLRNSSSPPTATAPAAAPTSKVRSGGPLSTSRANPTATSC